MQKILQPYQEHWY